jgi:hypothetical protein
MPKATKIKSNTCQKLYKKKELYKKNEKLKWEEWSFEKRMDVHFSVTDNHEKLMVDLLNYFEKIDDNKFHRLMVMYDRRGRMSKEYRKFGTFSSDWYLN